MRKFLSLIVCACLVLTLFTACAGKENKTQTADGDDLYFTLDYTVDSHYSVSESTLRAYTDLCDAVVNYQNEVRFNLAMVDDIDALFFTSFPLNPLVSGFNPLEDGSGFALSYVNAEEEHRQIVLDFNTAVRDIQTKCEYGRVNNYEYALRVYTWLATEIEPDDSVTTVMDAAIQKKGIESAVNGLFEYLMLQAGIEASHVISGDPTQLGKSYSLVSFRGGKYLFSPSDERKTTGGKGLDYFAMTLKRAGIAEKNSFTCTDGESITVSAESDLDILKGTASYAIGDAGNVEITYTDGKTETLDILNLV